MTGRGFVTVEIVSKSSAWVSGFNARGLLVEAGAKSPIWRPSRHAWSTSPKVARDLLALCDARSIPVRYVEGGGANA